MIKVLITDLDDTLYPWLQFFVPAFYAMAKEVSAIVHEEEETILSEYKAIHQNIGSVEVPFATLLLPSVKREFPNSTEAELKKYLDSAFHRFNSVRKHQLHLFPGVQETLKALRNDGVRIVGYTESASENGIYRLRQLGIEEYFSQIYVSDSWNTLKAVDAPVSAKAIVIHGKKPNAEVLRQIIADESVSISEAVYIGDSLTKDIYMAKQLGVTSVQFQGKQGDTAELYQKLVAISSWTDEIFAKEARLKKECVQENIRPDYTISEFGDLKAIIAALNKENDYGVE